MSHPGDLHQLAMQFYNEFPNTRTKEAQNLLSKAVRIDPEDLELRRSLGAILEKFFSSLFSLRLKKVVALVREET